MYESPITIYQSPEYRRMSESVDALVIDACRRVGVVVNKEELVKAMTYDRGQYEKGYEDALNERGIIYCGDCKYKDDGIDEDGIPFLKCLHGRSYGGTRINDFCSWAERSEEA